MIFKQISVGKDIDYDQLITYNLYIFLLFYFFFIMYYLIDHKIDNIDKYYGYIIKAILTLG